MKRLFTIVVFLLVLALAAEDIHPAGMKYLVTVGTEPSIGGTVSGGGIYSEFNTCTLTAIPNEGYRFVHWTHNGIIVSTSTTYQFMVSEDVTYTAHFHAVASQDAELGYSIYDWQSNSGARTWTHVWPDGKINFAYTVSNDNGNTTRGTGIETYDAVTRTWQWSDGRVETEKTGFGSIAQFGDNGIVVAAHTSNDCRIYIIPDKDNIASQSVSATAILNSPYLPSWPSVMTSGPNRGIIHVIANAATGTVPGMEDVNNPILYFRSSDGGQTWDQENVVLPFMGPEYSLSWESNSCYWMETTDDNCLALVVNNAWSDGMVIYSYDNGDTWQRKVFYKHPDPFGSFSDMMFYPRWTSCQWDSQHRLHVLYAFNAFYGNAGPYHTYDNSIGGVAYWNEQMPYNTQGTTQSDIPGNLTPGQPFVMEHAYLENDIYSSLWMFTEATHDMWPEYIGYLPPLTDAGDPEDPYLATDFNFNFYDINNHGHYSQGICSFPVLCMVPGTDEMVAVWSALDENHWDDNENFYYKIFASYSGNGGASWSPMIQLTRTHNYDHTEFIYNQASVVGRQLIIVSQTDAIAGCYTDLIYDDDPSDNHYQGLVFNIDDLFDTASVQDHTVTVEVDPVSMGGVTGGGSYHAGNTCNLLATPSDGCHFINWTKEGTVVSTHPAFSFVVTEDAHFVAHFTDQPVMHQVTATTNPVQGGSVSGIGSFEEGNWCILIANPNSGYRFVKWTRNEIQLSTFASFGFTVTQDVELEAHFEKLPYDAIVETDPAENGMVYSCETFPNPVERGQEVFIDLPTNHGSTTIEVVDMTGRIIVSIQGEGKHSISTTGMVPGIYTIVIRQMEGCLTKKLVIKE